MRTLFISILLLCSYSLSAQEKPYQVAFIADIHFADIFADYENFEGIPVPDRQKPAVIRSMNAQLHSTRLFNENYFVLKAVLDDLVAKGIKTVALPGDFTDDGQPVNLKGLAKILNEYKNNFGLSFFITTGNHDPVKPFGEPGGKSDFLTKNGQEQAIFSEKKRVNSTENHSDSILLEPGLKKAGYHTILKELENFGFYPDSSYVYWETPFSTYTTDSYTYQEAMAQSSIEKRIYPVEDTLKIPDVSYLVEPIDGLWLLAIDGNTYVPQADGGFSGAGLGYNNAINYKTHLFEWIAKIAQKAKKLNKCLVAFSHYPAVDFNDNASPLLKKLLGEEKMQLERVPEERIAEELAHAGIKLHFAGHMHLNDTGNRTYTNGNFIYNIQTPSLAAYIPGYKILTLTQKMAEIETVILEDIPDFNMLFPLYTRENDYLKKTGKEAWDPSILDSENYLKFTEQHLENLVKLRFLPNDWPAGFLDFFLPLTQENLIDISKYRGRLTLEEYVQRQIQDNSEFSTRQPPHKNSENWNGLTILMDFYKIKNADKLAFNHIAKQRIKDYKSIIQSFENNPKFNASTETNAEKLSLFMRAFQQMLEGLPANHFKINLKTGKIKNLD